MFIVEVDNFDSWRQQARELLKRNIAPDNIAWQCATQHSLLGDTSTAILALPIVHTELKLSRKFIKLAKTIACFRDEKRWALLYSVAWRLIFENRRLLEFTLDEQVSRLLSMHKTIRRDMHKMEAFVRFKRIDQNKWNDSSMTSKDELSEYYIAWFEPEHLIVPLKMSFFIKRFHNMRWSILTPDICAHWDMQQLTYSEGINCRPTIEDDLEKLWLEYYKNIFNPSRLKLKAMQSEMPKKYWANLPEAALIKELSRNAQTKMDNMITESGTPMWEKTARSKFIKKEQGRLRKNAKA